MKAKKKVWPRAAHFIRVPVFGMEMWFCGDAKTFSACRSFLTHEPDASTSSGRCTVLSEKKTGATVYLVGVFDGCPSTLAHELAHACFFIMKEVGVEAREGEKNETFCYLLGDLFKTIAPKLKKKK